MVASPAFSECNDPQMLLFVIIFGEEISNPSTIMTRIKGPHGALATSMTRGSFFCEKEKIDSVLGFPPQMITRTHYRKRGIGCTLSLHHLSRAKAQATFHDFGRVVC
ncbi:hypothetical protein Nepgr_005861 [Nepenthes gracilis]|uniref:Uncharacterized protein n=1 Tax=Nepenthes gracilis TaxID=150966 RepID=A0AAD3S4F2_NEPGR|nr:hypothetical protein Nepgr_005861 [Nepenthes gracilis]